MQYRVAFRLFGGQYFTEWFETFEEAELFVDRADKSGGAFALWIENEDEEII